MMTTLEKNNIEMQSQLMKDIIRNDSDIFYGVICRGKELINIFQNCIYDSSNKSYTINEEDFKKLVKIAYILSDDNQKGLSTLAEKAVSDNEMKKKILTMLQIQKQLEHFLEK